MLYDLGLTSTLCYQRKPYIEKFLTYPVDIFWTEFHSFDKVSDMVTKKHNIIFYEDIIYDNTIKTMMDTFNRHQDKLFYFFIPYQGFENIANWPKNVINVPYTFVSPLDEQDKNGYLSAKCLLEKNLQSKKIAISLNRLPRPHRLCWISFLLGNNYDKECVISAPLLQWHLSQDNSDIKNRLDWSGIDSSNDFGKKVLAGWTRAKTKDGLYVGLDAYPPYTELEPSAKKFLNFENYQTNLITLYKNSFIEYITATQYEKPLLQIDEKYLNSQLGCNFPIFLAGSGFVKLLRDYGFDVFDDILNHNYDKELDPKIRMEKAFNDNLHLFSDKDRIKNIWCDNKTRFQHNVDLSLKLKDQLPLDTVSNFQKIFDS
jgi:hypothetical protein